MKPDEKKIRTDWVAWCVYAVMGMAGGAVAGLLLTRRWNKSRPGELGEFALALLEIRGAIILGMALLGAGILSRWGDMLIHWPMRPDYLLNPGLFSRFQVYLLGRTGKRLSYTLILSGAGLLLAAGLRLTLA